MTQHLDSEKHKKNYLLSTRQALITTETQGGNLFYKEIAHAMISANIPLQKLDNPVFKASTNCNAERALSRFNDVLTDRRTNLTEENLSKFLFAMCKFNF